MTKNFPYNEGPTIETISKALDRLQEEDPEGFFRMQRHIESLMELSPRDFRLLRELEKAAPFDVTIPKHVRAQDPKIFPAEREVVLKTDFPGDMAGISVVLEPSEAFQEIRLVSLTMVELPLHHPLRKRVKDYQKKRIKYLRKRPPLE